MEIARIGNQPYQEENLQVGTQMLTLRQHTVIDCLAIKSYRLAIVYTLDALSIQHSSCEEEMEPDII